jgi:DNA-binding PadR family transcriptional regulator
MPESIDIQAFGRSLHEVLILAVLRGGPKHGYQIALDVEEETGGLFQFQHGTLYPILHRLEAAGRIKGKWDRGDGRRRKVYALTGAGETQLAETGEQVVAVLEALRALLGGGS